MLNTPHSTNQTESHRWLNLTEASAYLSLSKSTFRRRVDEGKLPAGKRVSERRLIWDRKTLDDFVENHCEE